MLNVTLVVVGGDAKAAEIRLKLPTTIGRAKEATLTLPHPLVSRQHCEIYEQNGELYVRDLKSLNGTYVDNHKITESELLKPNQLLTIGNVTFRAVYSLDSNAELDTEPQMKLETISGEDAPQVLEMENAADPMDESVHVKPTQSGNRREPAAQRTSEDLQETKQSVLKTIDARTMEHREVETQHSIVAAMADVEHPRAGKGSVSLSAIDRELPQKPVGDDQPQAVDIHDDENPNVHKPAESFHGVDAGDDESAGPVQSDDSALGSFIRKLPR